MAHAAEALPTPTKPNQIASRPIAELVMDSNLDRSKSPGHAL